MKILFLTTHLNYGGISSYTFSLAKELCELGNEVYIASASGDLMTPLKKTKIKHIHIPIKTKNELNPLILFSMFKLIGLIRRESIDIIHAQTRVTQVLASLLAKATKVPFVTTCHGFFRRNIGRQFFPCWGEKVIAISEAVRKHLMIDFYVEENDIAMVYNGIDIDYYRVPDKRTDLNYQDKTVGIVARLSSVKGHKYLIEAMAQVFAEFPEARLFMFGEGKIKYELVKQAQALKITDKAFFLPAVSNTSEVLQEIDIFVMPSLQEGLGLSILEAQACGLPVIASNVGGIPSLVKNEVTGLLVEPQDARALAAEIMKVMENKTLAMRLGKAGRKQVEEKFNLKQMAKKIEQIYQGIVKK